MKKIILALILCVVPLKAHSKSVSSGPGNFKCEKYNSSNTVLKNTFFSWVEGFMTGMNLETYAADKEFVDLGSPEFDPVAQQGLLTSLCLRHPDDLVINQALQVLVQMKKMGLTVHVEETKP